ncbi:hypothetical protein LWU70_20365 [Enterobacter hormaechei]|nr:hypothetical protein [Enterobacter hormaechei]
MVDFDFLSNYMSDYRDDYILIGGNACALNFNNMGVDFRATVDLDVVLVIDSDNQKFYEHLRNYLSEHDYVGKTYNGSNTGGSSYRFVLPEVKKKDGLPEQIELFSRKPNYFDASAEKPHITPIHIDGNISNLSAILLDDDIYDFIRNSKIIINDVSTVNLECLIGLKSIAWHANQDLYDQGIVKELVTVWKHASDIISIVGVIEDLTYSYPRVIFESLQVSKEKFKQRDIFENISVSQDEVDAAIYFIENNVV